MWQSVAHLAQDPKFCHRLALCDFCELGISAIGAVLNHVRTTLVESLGLRSTAR